MDKSAAKKPKKRREEIHTNWENVRPVYANWAQLAVTDNDIRLSFGELLEHTPERSVTREQARIYMTVRVAKSVLALLADAVKKHEAQHGPKVQAAPINEK